MTTTVNEKSAQERIDPAVLKLALVMITGAAAGLLDTTIVNVAIRSIGSGLNAPLSSVQWVMTGYLLSYGMVIPLNGWALARFGARATWLTSLGIFLISSMACGVAPDIGMLIAFRVVQGTGGGMLIPVLTTVLIQASGGKALGRLMATVSMPIVVVPILGPVVGGLIAANLDWRWIFYVNVPVCTVGMLLAWRHMPRQEPRNDESRPDIAGIGLLSPAVAALLYGLANASSPRGFGQPDVLVPVAAGVVLLAVFVIRGLSATSGVLDLKLFRVRSFTGASSLMFISGLSLYGALFLLPLYFQEVRHRRRTGGRAADGTTGNRLTAAAHAGREANRQHRSAAGRAGGHACRRGGDGAVRLGWDAHQLRAAQPGAGRPGRPA